MSLQSKANMQDTGSSPNQLHYRPGAAKAETNQHTPLILNALTLIFIHIKLWHDTHPFVHSQGIFQWAKPSTGYTAADTSAQCMSQKLPCFLALSLFYFCLIFFTFALISDFPKQWYKQHNTVERQKKRISKSWGERNESSALLVRDVYLFIM